MEQHTEITVRKFNELHKFRIISQILKTPRLRQFEDLATQRNGN